MVRIRWTQLALQDLEDARSRLESEAPAAWSRVAARIRKALAQLRRHPLSGRVVPERRSLSYREMVLPPFRLVYAVAGRELHILRLWHARRDPTKLEDL